MVRLFIVCLFLMTTTAEASWKIRAREHFIENHKVTLPSGEDAVYGGLSNTLNLWYEKPFNYSIGFAISPILGSSKSRKDEAIELGDSFQLQAYGFEAKYFPIDSVKAFIRVGGAYTRISSNKGTLDGSEGSSYYGGIGFEFPVFSAYVAPEVGTRRSKLEDDLELETFIFAIGVHFYEMF